MPRPTDERLAAALEAARRPIAGEARAEADDTVRLLVEAFGRGRWGGFWCRFAEPARALRALVDLAPVVARQLCREPDAPELLGRLVEAVAELSVIVAIQERTRRHEEVDELRELLAVKNDFLRLTVHELRRPLGLANGYLSIIQDREQRPDVGHVQAMYDQLAAAHQQLEALLVDLTGIIQLDDGAAVLQLAPLRLGPVIDGAIEATAQQAASKRVHLEADITDREARFTGDQGRLQTAIVNLIDNAIQYGPDGGRVQVAGSRRMNGVSIAVTDEGPGIDPQEVPRLFEAHRRGVPSGAPGGLGLGLTIVQRIVALHHGHLTVDSPLGQGTTFTIYLPISLEGST